MGLNYSDLELPVYRNTAEIINFTAYKEKNAIRCALTLSDLVFAAEVSGLNMLFISDVGRGKSQLIADIDNAHFAGLGNKMKGRKDASVLDLFERTSVDLSTGKFDSETARTLHAERLGSMLNTADELNRAPGPVQVDFFDLADRAYTFRGKTMELGREGYALFLATMNLNKSGDNGFSGTFDVDRALYSRAHLTIDLDHKPFRPTPEDKLYISSRIIDPRVKQTGKKDLSAEILQANKEIKKRSLENSLDNKIFSFLIDEGLHYCEKDPYYHEKQGTWPMACLDCPHASKICSSIKSSSVRTVESIALLAQGLIYVAELKYGELTIPAFDAFLEAFKFTTYHGNLNEIVIGEKYAGRRQILMDETISKLREIIDCIKPFMTEGKLNTSLIKMTLPGQNPSLTENNPDLIRTLEQKKIPYEILVLEKVLKDKNIETSWIESLRQ